MRVLAELTGNKLVEFPMNSDADTTELLGGFEQVLFFPLLFSIAFVGVHLEV